MKKRLLLFITISFLSLGVVDKVFGADNQFNANNGIIFYDESSSGCGASCTVISDSDFVYYSQNDIKWSGEAYGNSTTIKTSGCGPTSMAMIVATLKADKTVTPKETAELSLANGALIEGIGTDSAKLIKIATEKWGLDYRDISNQDISVAIEAINAGGLVYISGSGANPYTELGHIVVMRGVTSDGRIVIADPYRGSKDIYNSKAITTGRAATYVITKKTTGSTN